MRSVLFFSIYYHNKIVTPQRTVNYALAFPPTSSGLSSAGPSLKRVSCCASVSKLFVYCNSAWDCAIAVLRHTRDFMKACSSLGHLFFISTLKAFCTTYTPNLQSRYSRHFKDRSACFLLLLCYSKAFRESRTEPRTQSARSFYTHLCFCPTTCKEMLHKFGFIEQGYRVAPLARDVEEDYSNLALFISICMDSQSTATNLPRFPGFEL